MNVGSKPASPSTTRLAPLTSFVGREPEVAELLAIIEKSRLVTLTGAGGCGKTRLALRVATDVETGYPEGVWWIELAAVSQPEKVPLAVVNGLHLREEPGRPPLQTLAEQLAGRRALLVLDNCEHVLGPCAALVEELIGDSPTLTVLVTSREPLGIAGELVWRVPSLDGESAALLFVERAAQIRPGFTPNSSEMDAIAQICRRLDGIPLAIELAAARCRMMNPAKIATGLDDRFRLLTGGVRTSVPRQQTLETSVAWSYDLLDGAERAVLRRLSVFAGGFTLDAAEAVCADDEVDEYAVLDLVSRLVDKSVVQVDHLDAESRYRLLETVRLYMRDRLLEAGEIDASRDRHCEFFLRLAETAEPGLAGPEGPRWLGRLEDEHDNLRSALEWADSSGNRTSSLRLCTALTLFWELRGHLGEGCRWFDRVLQFDDEPSVARARSLWGAAHAAVYHDDYQTATLRAPQALEMGRKLGDDWAMARALNTLGWIRLWFEPDQAVEALKQSIELGHRTGDNWVIADGWKMITLAWLVKEEHSGFRDALVELYRVATALENKFFLAWHQCCIGWIEAREGDFEAARAALEDSLRLCEEVGEPATGGVAVAVLGEVESLTGDHDSAEDRLNRFLERAAVTGGASGVPCALLVMAALALGGGNPSGAREILDPFVDEMRKLGLPIFLSGASACWAPPWSLKATSREQRASSLKPKQPGRLCRTAG
jgi:predicted ATPase